jgi:hypothetical protein
MRGECEWRKYCEGKYFEAKNDVEVKVGKY